MATQQPLPPSLPSLEPTEDDTSFELDSDSSPKEVEVDPSQLALLLDDEGALTPKFEAILRRIFLLHASPTSPASSGEERKEEEEETKGKDAKLEAEEAGNEMDSYEVFSNEKTLNRQDCDKFAEATNGHPMLEDTWTEICQYFDVIESEASSTKEKGVGEEEEEEEEDEVKEALQDDLPTNEKARLTFKGFLQLYQLQTENDATETINDLTSWGYNLDTDEGEFVLIKSRGRRTEEEELKEALQKK